MKALLTVLSLIFLTHVRANGNIGFKCYDESVSHIGVLYKVNSYNKKYNGANYYLQRNGSCDEIQIGINNWTGLNSKTFKFCSKTIFVIHGYFADRKAAFLSELMKELNNIEDANIISVDWSSGSQTQNYFDAVETANLVAQDTVRFLQGILKEIKDRGIPVSLRWANLYLIGHSLGAHVSGQIGYLLKQNNEHPFIVRRITGLDPILPCFSNAPLRNRLDPSDANLVDVIHTQTSHISEQALGYKDPLGHIDFYVNGGVSQPACELSSKTPKDEILCSHFISVRYMAQSLRHSKLKDCKFVGYKWDGTVDDGLRILSDVKNGSNCTNCPEMGINAVNHIQVTGKYLVILPTRLPYCKRKNEDITQISTVIKMIHPNRTTKKCPGYGQRLILKN